MFSSLTVECEIRSDVQIVGEREDSDEETWMPALSNIDLVLVEQVSEKSGESEQVSIKFCKLHNRPRLFHAYRHSGTHSIKIMR